MPAWISTTAPRRLDCCHFMRRISEFNVPASLAPPHFTPHIDLEKCNYCGKCALACPMGAVTVDTVNQTAGFEVFLRQFAPTSLFSPIDHVKIWGSVSEKGVDVIFIE